METLKKIFFKLFRIKPEEFSLVQNLFFFFTGIGTLFTLGAASGDALMLSQFGDHSEQMLPYVYLGVALSSLLMTFIYDRIQIRFKRKTLLTASFLILGFSILLLRTLFYWSNGLWLYYLLVIWLETCSLLSMMLFFSFSGDYFTAFDARRVYGYIAGGLPLGTILGGLLLTPLISAFGSLNVLYTAAFLQASGAIWVSRISRKNTPVLSEKEDQKDSGASLKEMAKNRYLLFLVLFVFISFICFRLVEYLFQIRAAHEMHGDTLALFFGNFYLWLGAAQMGIQFGLAGFLFKKLGAVNSLMLLPLFMLGTHTLLIFFPGLLLVWASGNFFRLSFSETIDLPAMEMLFLPLPKKTRIRVQALFSGALIPLGSGLGGVLILLLLNWITQQRDFTFLTLGVALIYLMFILLIKPQYKKMLSDSLKDREFLSFHAEIPLNSEALKIVMHHLDQSGKTEEILLTLDVLSRHAPSEAFLELKKWIFHPQDSIALKTLSLMTDKLPRKRLEILSLAIDHPSPAVKARALILKAPFLQKAIQEEASRLLNSPLPELQTAALTALLLSKDAQLMRRASESILPWIESSNPAKIKSGLDIFKTAQIPLPAETLESLSHSPYLEIQEKILELCAGDTRIESLRILTRALKNNLLRKTAETVLNHAAPIFCGAVCEVLTQDSLILIQKQVLFRFLEQKAGIPEIRFLLDFLFRPEEEMRLKVSSGRALRGIFRRNSFSNPQELDSFILEASRELTLSHEAYFELLSVQPALSKLFWDRGLLWFDVLISLLQGYGNARQLKKIENHLLNSNNIIRSNALELLEFSLPARLKKPVLESLAHFIQKNQSQGKGLTENTFALLTLRDPWIQGLALYSRFQNSSGEITMTQEKSSLFELIARTSFLKKVTLFQEVPSEYLIHLAELAKEVSYHPGEFLVQEGEEGDSLFLIQAGEVEIQKTGVTLTRLGEGECIGEMALIEDLPRSATCIASQETLTLRIDKEDFISLMDSQPQIVRALLMTMTRRLRAMG